MKWKGEEIIKAGAAMGDGGDTTELHYGFGGRSERRQLGEGGDDEP